MLTRPSVAASKYNLALLRRQRNDNSFANVSRSTLPCTDLTTARRWMQHGKLDVCVVILHKSRKSVKQQKKTRLSSRCLSSVKLRSTDSVNPRAVLSRVRPCYRHLPINNIISLEGTTTCCGGGTCGSVHVESFNKNMKAFGVLESKWDLIRQKLVRRLRSRTRCYGPTSHRKGGREVKGGKGFRASVGNMSSGTCMREEGANSVCGPTLNDQIVF